MLKILVAIASYGTGNDGYLSRLLDEYRKMPYDVHIVVLSNVPKNLSPEIEVRVGLPAKNPRSLPFGHKSILAERLEQYDLFIYSEDDTLITEQNIEAFLKVTALLPENEVAGFIRSETDATGKLYISTAHGHFHWLQNSVRSIGDCTFAKFTNQHSGCFVLTRDQLRRVIASGGFLVEPHEGRYQLLETAATDPYTQCGMEKVICISEIEDFIVPHLPNKYAGTLGVDKQIFQKLVDAMLKAESNRSGSRDLLDTETKLSYAMWSKDYYEPCQSEALMLIPDNCRTVLSIGCGWGETENALAAKGLEVTVIPLDWIIASCIDNEKIRIVHGDLASAREQLMHEQFDCILFSNILHLMTDPAAILCQFVSLLSKSGILIVAVPNFAKLTTFWNRLLRRRPYCELGSQNTGVHLTSYQTVRRWLKQCQIGVFAATPIVPERFRRISQLSSDSFRRLFANNIVIAGRRD